MRIQQYKKLEYDAAFNAFFELNLEWKHSISLIILFFRHAVSYFKHHNDLSLKENIDKIVQYGMGFEHVDVSVDNINNLIYICEYYYGSDRQTTPEIEALLEKEDFIVLCKIGFLEHVILTKDNFTHLIFAWNQMIQQKTPFLLLYQDDKNWYDVLPFETSEAMQKFVTDHIEPK